MVDFKTLEAFVRVAQLGGLMKYFDLKARSCA